MKTSAELRTAFLDYFVDRGHTKVASSSLVPHDDPTLLFTNAGMVQFKDVFLGRDKRSYSRAASSQRCVRAGGKHNDLENVGYTARHHTFFEMLGNFSFGDYFKREAIDYAWEFLTKELKIPQEKLWITVYEEDDEAEEIWLNEIGVDPKRMSRCGAKDNFWAMGDTGPCGPCSEIFYDHGPDVWGGPPGSPEEDGDRYIEIWNLVFTQFNRDSDGNLTPLPRPSVDTGMGLERLAAVMQGVHSNYQIDLFTNLIAAVVDVTGSSGSDDTGSSLNVIADHIRSCAFMIVDGVLPSNEGRGYVLRRIIRRAIRHGYMLGTKEPFFSRLVEPLCSEMGEAYPELLKAKKEVERVLLQEEERFAETLEQGMKILSQEIEGQKGKQISGEVVFKLYDTYGFPTDLTADIARERDMTLDMDGFEREMEAQRERARAASRFGADQTVSIDMEGETDFTGYERQEEQATIIALLQEGKEVDAMGDGEEGMVVLDRTPFYAEAGGQVGDSGRLLSGDDYFEVVDTRKQGSDLIIHSGRFHGPALHVGDSVNAQVDRERRGSIVLNHSATHLLHAALRKTLGEHVTQKGSLVDADRLRFDFAHPEPVPREQLQAIERMVNRQIRENDVIETRIMSLEDAKTSGAVALFGEKYSEQVRVLKIGEFSTELCGGTHAKEAGEIGLFKITAEMGIASGVRRIEAVTGEHAISWIAADDKRLWRLADILKVGRDGIEERVVQMTEATRQLEKELEQLKGKLASAAGSDLASSAVEVKGVKVLAAKLDGADAKSLRDTMDQLKSKLGSAAIVLAAVDGDKVSLVAGVTKDQVKQLKAGDLVKMVATQVGGKGGGRPDLAQAGGNKPEALDGALASVMPWVEEQLSS